MIEALSGYRYLALVAVAEQDGEVVRGDAIKPNLILRRHAGLLANAFFALAIVLSLVFAAEVR